MITSSAQQALWLVFDYLTKQGNKSILLQEPTYFGTLRAIRKQGINAMPFSDAGSINDLVGGLPLYITSNFHNPTGYCLPEKRKESLAQKAVSKKGIIIEDNPYDFLYYGSEKPSTILDLAPENTIHIGGFSKILAPGLRTGYLIAPERVLAKIKSEKITLDLFTSTLSQQVCSIALQQPYMNELRAYFKEKRDYALKCLNALSKGKEGMFWSMPEGGIFLQASISRGIDVANVAKIAKEKYGLELEEDQFFYYDGKSRNTTRINFVRNPAGLFREGIERLYKSITEAQQCQSLKS